MARRPAADADGVIPLRLQVEQREERHHAEDLRQRQIHLIRDVFQNVGREELVGVVVLDLFQDPQKRTRLAGMRGDHAIDERLLFQRQNALTWSGYHRASETRE